MIDDNNGTTAFCRGFLQEQGYLVIHKDRVKLLTISQGVSFVQSHQIGEDLPRYREMLKDTAGRALGAEALQYAKVTESHDAYRDITRYELTIVAPK